MLCLVVMSFFLFMTVTDVAAATIYGSTCQYVDTAAQQVWWYESNFFSEDTNNNIRPESDLAVSVVAFAENMESAGYPDYAPYNSYFDEDDDHETLHITVNAVLDHNLIRFFTDFYYNYIEEFKVKVRVYSYGSGQYISGVSHTPEELLVAGDKGLFADEGDWTTLAEWGMDALFTFAAIWDIFDFSDIAEMYVESQFGNFHPGVITNAQASGDWRIYKFENGVDEVGNSFDIDTLSFHIKLNPMTNNAGTYRVEILWYAKIERQIYGPDGFPLGREVDYTATGGIERNYIKQTPTNTGGGGGGCPNLLVKSDEGYVDTGFLEIHDDTALDKVIGRSVSPTLVDFENKKFRFRLEEVGWGYNYSESYIDSVSVVIITKDGRQISGRMISAIHSTDGSVKWLTRFSDDNRVQIEKGEYIDFRFGIRSISPNQIGKILFIIEGYNPFKV
ncbi:MAG: hypothetical protein ACFFCZ_27355 [Promethearchaeota archaeon]